MSIHVRGEYIKQIRLSNNFSRTTAAKYLELSPRIIRRIEESKRKCSVGEINLLATLYHIEPTSIVRDYEWKRKVEQWILQR